jgi:hypothetical protein
VQSFKTAVRLSKDGRQGLNSRQSSVHLCSMLTDRTQHCPYTNGHPLPFYGKASRHAALETRPPASLTSTRFRHDISFVLSKPKRKRHQLRRLIQAQNYDAPHLVSRVTISMKLSSLTAPIPNPRPRFNE